MVDLDLLPPSEGEQRFSFLGLSALYERQLRDRMKTML